MKYFLLIFLFCSSVVFSQKMKQIKIVDLENSKAIPNARIIFDHQIYYSNDDGFISLPENAKSFDVSISGYQSLSISDFQSIIHLKPLYKDIDEVKIVSVDVKKIFNEVYKNYNKIYYNKPAIYDITYSQKSFENNQMKLLMVADGKFWTRDGNYNAKEAFNNRFDNFVQMQIDDLRYLKTEKGDFDIKMKNQKGNHEFVGNFFFDYELYRIISLSNRKKSITSARIIYENQTEQEISYKIKMEADLIYTGNIIFNKKDRAITHYELVFDQKNHQPTEYKDLDGEKFQQQLPNGIYVFDFYKSGEKYVPSKISLKFEGTKFTQGDKVFDFRNSREIIFKNFKGTDEKGLQNPVIIKGVFWKDMRVSDEKGMVNLSKEEQDFINEKADEN